MPGQDDGMSAINEALSSASHLAGAAAFAWPEVSLVPRGRGDFRRTLSLGMYAFSCVPLLCVAVRQKIGRARGDKTITVSGNLAAGAP